MHSHIANTANEFGLSKNGVNSVTSNDTALASNRSLELYGPSPETTIIQPIINALGAEPTITYIAGSRGSGKTLLAKSLLAQAHTQGIHTLYSNGMEIDPHQNALLIHLLQSLALHPSDIYLDTVIEAIRNIASDRGFVWVVDNYDAWYDLDRWLRTVFVPRLPPQTSLVLTGSNLVRRLWVGDVEWQRRVRLITLQDLKPDVVRRVIAESGVREPAMIETVTHLANGKPKLLSILLDSLQLLDQSSVFAQETRTWPDLASFLIEQILHPGSRRLTWRGGLGSLSVDTLLAAASILPWVDRRIMQIMVGRSTVEDHWNEFIQLPIVSERPGGFYSLSPTLRHYVASSAMQTRPWTWTHWRIKARKHLLQNARYEGDSAARTWAQLSYLVREWVWQGALHPFADLPEPWDFIWETLGDGLDTRRVMACAPDGAIVGALSLTEDPLAASGSPTLVVSGYQVTDTTALPALLRELASEFHRYGAIYWTADVGSGDIAAYMTNALTALQFQFVKEPRERWVLDLGSGYADWLAKVSLCSRIVPSMADSLAVVKDALSHVQDLHALETCEIAQWAEVLIDTRSPRLIRTWLLDALLSADLGEWPSGQILLTLYYVDQAGPHEALAERLNLSRATYFRSHQRALRKFAQALLDPETISL